MLVFSPWMLCSHGEPEHAGGLVDAQVERIDVGAHAAARAAA